MNRGFFLLDAFNPKTISKILKNRVLLIFSNSSINSKMKRMLTMLAYALIAYALLLILLFVFQRSYLYFPDKETIPLHYFDEFNIEKIKHTTDDGLTLAGWYKKPDTNNTNIFFFDARKRRTRGSSS